MENEPKASEAEIKKINEGDAQGNNKERNQSDINEKDNRKDEKESKDNEDINICTDFLNNIWNERQATIQIGDDNENKKKSQEKSKPFRFSLNDPLDKSIDNEEPSAMQVPKESLKRAINNDPIIKKVVPEPIKKPVVEEVIKDLDKNKLSIEQEDSLSETLEKPNNIAAEKKTPSIERTKHQELPLGNQPVQATVESPKFKNDPSSGQNNRNNNTAIAKEKPPKEINAQLANSKAILISSSKTFDSKKSDPDLYIACKRLLNDIFGGYQINSRTPSKCNTKEILFAPSSNNQNVDFKEAQIQKIQSFWKTSHSQERIQMLKDKTFYIQRAFRKYLILKYSLPENFYYNDKFIKLQNDIYEENLKENLSVLFPALFVDKTDLNSLASNMLSFSNNPIHNPYENGKINLFAKILDFDLMIESDESYETLWASVFDSIYSKCLKNCAPIQLIAVGGQHTLCVNNKGKIFTFGWNNYGQCGVPINSTVISKEELNDDYLVEITKFNELKPKIINRVDGVKIPEIDMVIMSSSIACGEDHSLILDQEGAVWAFGLNLNGQLGLGHANIIEKPTKITELSKYVITSVKTEGNINFAINNKGEAFMWPWSDKGEIQFVPRKLPLKKMNEKVASIACGNNFVLILGTGGSVYSMGKTNKFGQLGHGDYNPRLHPTCIEFFVSNGERITQISCGFKHCVAKSSTGRAYTWGLGVKGQLGQDSFTNYSIPMQVRFDIPFAKVYQVSAGFRSTFFLIENRKVYSCGCNGTISMEKTPVPFSVLEKIPEMALEQNYSLIRIRNTWNKSFSIFYATIADTSTMKISPVKLSNILNQVAMKWESETVDMPYIEAYAKFFPINVMKKPKDN